MAHLLAAEGPNEKKCKIRSKGVVKGSRDPLHISRTVEARNFKFGRQTGHWGPNEKNAKLGQQKGS